MTSFGPLDTIFLSVFLLLLLALATVEACRRAHVAAYDDEEAFLFRGRQPVHALASNIGATFSLTYFFGAVVIYAQLFETWMIVAFAVTFFVVAMLYRKALKIIECELPSDAWSGQRGNLLLEMLKRRYAPAAFDSVCSLFLVIYVAFLAEELAVSRLVFSALVSNPLVVAFLLSVVCLIIVIYLSYGGFRAVLTADYIQGAVLCAFFLMLAIIVVERGKLDNLVHFPTTNITISFANLGMMMILAFAWFLAGVDYFSRFNFESRSPREIAKTRASLANITASLLFVCFSLGILFSQAIGAEVSTTVAPSKYVSLLIGFFLTKTPPIYRVVFIVSLHCMVFTTVNTILMTVLQVSAYKVRNPLNRARVLPIILVAALGSVVIEGDHVHTIGIFIVSLLMLPAFPAAKGLFPRLAWWVPGSATYLWWALGGSVLLFAAAEPKIASRFEYHFLIPAIPTGMAAIGIGLTQVIDIIGRKGRQGC
jgi:Na+/pantothenate symporter